MAARGTKKPRTRRGQLVKNPRKGYQYAIAGLPASSTADRSRVWRRNCGYALVNKGHDTRAIQGWLGHGSITSTAVYTALAPNRFKDFWRD
jgi:site-specific recombinase XerD